MDYETAKRLKDAGFPGSEKWVFSTDLVTFDNPYAVSLSEFIKAVGDRFYVLVFDYRNKTWFAEAWETLADLNQEVRVRIVAGGNNPEKAVAELWLKLNAKK